jgi:predicted flap endonuclease-1-like 5' DNA nuclease
LIGAVVFIIVFILLLLLSLVGITIPPGDLIVREFIPDLLQTDYATIAEGIINGVIFGIIIWAIFSVIKLIYDKTQQPKKIVVNLENEEIIEPVSPSSRITEIEGIGNSYSKKLNLAGIKTTDELLNVGSTKAGRKELAEKTGIAETVILEWVNMADLFRIKGIGEEYSDLLKEAGISTVVELARRNSKNLHGTIIGVNDVKKLVKRPPSLNQIQDWIEQANALERKVEY